MVTLQHVNPSSTRVYFGTLTGGENLHEAFAAIVQRHWIKAATIEMLGGLSAVEFTEYDFVAQTRRPALRFERAMEIVNGHGTVSLLDGKPHVHIHLALSFRDSEAPHGISVVGGHCASARAFAVEFVLTAYDGAPVSRGLDAATGLQLWEMGGAHV
jgi:predicted DNA-binding protein with PD1-like motif